MKRIVLLAFLIAFLTVLGCAGSGQALQCQLAAVSKLPVNDPDTLTLGQVRALATDLKACAPTSGDAGPAL